jgi:hypothetical protein
MAIDAARTILLYVIVPLWILAGLADWWCHRRSRIEATSGIRESLLHLLQFAEIGAGLLIALLLEINPLVLLLLVALIVVHELTAIWDVNIATAQRDVSPTEQHVHAALEMLPIVSLAVICTAYWPQVLALFGVGEASSITLQWKRDPIPLSYLLALFAAIALFVVVPYLEELYRCHRARMR